MDRGTPEWFRFVAQQKSIIEARIAKYTNVDTLKKDMEEMERPSHYQNYKSNSVSPYLLEALERLHKGKYGICVVCTKQIPMQRLELVPGALSCVKCDSQKPRIN